MQFKENYEVNIWVFVAWAKKPGSPLHYLVFPLPLSTFPLCEGGCYSHLCDCCFFALLHNFKSQVIYP